MHCLIFGLWLDYLHDLRLPALDTSILSGNIPSMLGVSAAAVVVNDTHFQSYAFVCDTSESLAAVLQADRDYRVSDAWQVFSQTWRYFIGGRAAAIGP